MPRAKASVQKIIVKVINQSPLGPVHMHNAVRKSEKSLNEG